MGLWLCLAFTSSFPVLKNGCMINLPLICETSGLEIKNKKRKRIATLNWLAGLLRVGSTLFDRVDWTGDAIVAGHGACFTTKQGLQTGLAIE